MYNDNYYPSTSEDDFNSAAAYSEYDSEPYTSDEWLNSQETTPILPLPEDGSDWSDQEDDFDMRTGLPVPCRQCPGALCPTGRLPRFLTGPDAPFPTDPDGPTGRFLLYPTGPDGRTDRFPRFLTDPDAPFPTDRDGLTGPFLPDPFLPGPFRLYAPTGPGTGVQSCPASFFRSPLPASDSTMHLSGDRFRST